MTLAPPPSLARTSPAAVRRPLVGLDAEKVRFSLERKLAAALTAIAGFEQHRRSLVPRDSELIRRRLLADALRLTSSMAPSAYAQAEDARKTLGIEGSLELYQSAGRENAALHLVESPILLEIQGRMLSLLDHDAGVALFGHELGHYLAHGPWTELGSTAVVGIRLAEAGVLSSSEAETARRLVVAREITADRFGLLAVQDLDAALRLEMIATTGLSGEALTWDTKAYLEQSRELMESTLSRGEAALSTTHPEHSLRAWALWLFSESDAYRALCGQGSGTRKLGEIDELVAKVLGVAELDGSHDVRDEPPSFLAECALACAVLVANADGEVAPEELDAIEDAFGRSVPGWAELLDAEVALERFYETGGMVRAGGPDLVRRIFLLLTHVMGADDVVDAREVQMILSIGEALGHGADFRRWIRPAIEAIGAPLEVELLESVALPLPVRKREVDDALEALCLSVERRGESVIAPRRIFRLMGASPLDEAVIQRVDEVFRARGIDATPPILQAGLDESVRLVCSRGPGSTDSAPPLELSATRQSLLAAVTRLRDELISGDGRSPSVRLRRLVRGRVFDLMSLDKVRPGTAERTLQLVQQGRAATLVTAEDAGRHDAAEQCSTDLRTLDREHRDRREETGANDLYLGYPVLVGNVAPRGETQPGYGVRAPLVLHPVELRRDGRGARGFSIAPRTDEEPVANQSLVRLLFNKANLALPDELSRELDEIAADPARGTADLLKRLREVGIHAQAEGTALVPFASRDADLDEAAPFLAIEECALLGLFPQSSSDLLQDFDALIRSLADPHAALPDLLAAAVDLLPAGLAPVSSEMRGDTEPPGWPVVPADPSQRAVVERIRANRVTVVDGPPGTGKSQLIVNLVADALRRGERVAVVAEKRAALDVVAQRLDGRGLSRFIAVVHDVHDDRKPLFEKIRGRVQATPTKAKIEARLGVVRSEYAQAEAALQADALLLGAPCDPAGLSVGQLTALACGGETILAEPTLADLSIDALRRLLELVERLHAHQDLFSPTSWWRTRGAGRRGSLQRFDDAALYGLLERVRGATALAEAFEASVSAAPVREDELARASEAISAAVKSVEQRASTEDARCFVALVVHGDEGIADLVSGWAERSTELTRWSTPTGMAVDDDLARSVAVLRSFVGRIGRFFSPLWWRTRGDARRALARAWPERAGSPFSAEFLDELRSRIEASRAWAQAGAFYRRLGIPELAPTRAEGAQATLERLSALAVTARTIAHGAPALAALGIAMPVDVVALPELDRAVSGRAEQLRALEALRRETAALAELFPFIARAGAEELRTLALRLSQDGHRLREVDGWVSMVEEVLGNGRAVLDGVAAGLPDGAISEWREAIARAWARAHLDRARVRTPRLEELGTAAADQRAARAAETMRRLEEEIRDLEVTRIAARLDDAELLQTPDAAYRARRTDAQKAKEALIKEVSKKSRLMPLRRFVREFAGVGLLEVLPCWLLSPETMAVLFPREPLFDLVIFDEASQCTVEAGLPVMLRAKRVVIAGDEKQMPPTSFFSLGSSSTDDEDRSEQELKARDAFSAESLLALARSRCPHAGLTWHYRCRDESLIAFSNHAMYDGELLTIPSTNGPDAKPALRWIDVPNGKYDAGLNRPEAERVVDLIGELLGRDASPTVGVVTFNLRQRQTVIEAIEARVAADATFAERWRAANEVEAIDDRPFVKNLESVQGDERDVIIFSVGHAPIERRRKGGATELYVPARFGPLGQRGGERRLNVAVSRAKAECYVVASFDPKLLHVGDSKHDGPRLFKAFLEFAHALGSGKRLHAERILDDVRGRRLAGGEATSRALVDGHVPVATQIAIALEGNGLRCELGLGSSLFRIPLAIGRVGEDGYRLAVLTDEGSTASAFERYVHRPTVLGLRGWEVMHVSAATWARRRADVVGEIARRVEGNAMRG